MKGKEGVKGSLGGGETCVEKGDWTIAVRRGEETLAPIPS